MKYCPQCGTPVTDGIFCANCGTPCGDVPAASDFRPAGGLGGPGAVDFPQEKVPVISEVVEYPEAEPVHAPSMADKTVRKRRRISFGKELRLLLRQGILVLLGEKRNLIISLLFPFIAAFITVWIAGKDMFVTMEATKSACFILVCAAIWGGLFNSIQSLVKERENIKRDYVSGALRIGCYMWSRSIIQFVLCVFQSLILMLSIPAVEWVYGNELPQAGLLCDQVLVEFYLVLFLIMFASDALGLLISSIVKKDELASKLAPYILIAQLLFSGVLFDLEGGASVLSAIMISRWGMESLGSICDLNNRVTAVYDNLIKEGQATEGGPFDVLKYAEEASGFEATASHLWLVIGIMALFVIVPLLLSNVMLHRVKHDGRD